MQPIKIMGVIVGQGEIFDPTVDGEFVLGFFKPNKEVCKIPEGSIAVDLIEGTWRSYDSEGAKIDEGLIFEQLA